MPWPFQAPPLHAKNTTHFFLGTSSTPTLHSSPGMHCDPVSQHWHCQRAGSGFSLSQFRVPKAGNASTTSQSPPTKGTEAAQMPGLEGAPAGDAHQPSDTHTQQCTKAPPEQLPGGSARRPGVMGTAGFNESGVFITELHKSTSHCPTSSLPTQLFARVIESFSQTLYIPLWFGDNAAEIRLPSIFLNVFNLNRRLKSKIVQLMDSSPSSTSTP